MKQGLSLTEIAQELERQVQTRKDYIAPQGRVEAIVRDSSVMLDGVNGEPFGITDHAHRQFGDVLGIPARYYDRMRAEQPDLLATNINTWLRAKPEDKRMIRTLDGNVRAVLSPKFRPLDNYDLAQAVLPKLMALQARVMSCQLTETRMYIKAILPELSDTLPDGMVWGNGHNQVAEYGSNEAGRVVAALVVSNSEVGAGTLRVEPSVFTTWCTNLAVMKEASMRKYHVGRANQISENWEVFRDETRKADDRAFFLKVTDVTTAAFDPKIFAAAVRQLREATTEKIESHDLPKVVDATVRQLSLPVSTSGSILTYLAQGGDLSKWGLASAVTATANNVDDYEGATALERAGGEILAMQDGQWRAIATAA